MIIYRYRLINAPVFSMRSGKVAPRRRTFDGYVARGRGNAVGTGDTPQEAVLDMRRDYVFMHKGREAIRQREVAKKMRALFEEPTLFSED